MTKQEYHFYDKPSPWFHIPANCPFGHKINVKSLRGKLTRGWTWLRLVDTHLQSMFQPCLGSHKENIATVFMKIMKTFCASKIPLPKISFKKYLELWRCLMHFKSRHRQVWSQVWLLNILKLKSQQRLVASNLQRSKHFCINLSCAISHKGSRKINGFIYQLTRSQDNSEMSKVFQVFGIGFG